MAIAENIKKKSDAILNFLNAKITFNGLVEAFFTENTGRTGSVLLDDLTHQLYIGALIQVENALMTHGIDENTIYSMVEEFWATKKFPPTEDKANHPSHYTSYQGLEIIDLTEQMNFNRGNAVKYITRAGLKNPEMEIEDLEKACWYVTREIQRLKKNRNEGDHDPLGEAISFMKKTNPSKKNSQTCGLCGKSMIEGEGTDDCEYWFCPDSSHHGVVGGSFTEVRPKRVENLENSNFDSDKPLYSYSWEGHEDCPVCGKRLVVHPDNRLVRRCTNLHGIMRVTSSGWQWVPTEIATKYPYRSKAQNNSHAE